MKILTTAQIRDLDAYTIRHEPIRSIDLMERAAGKFVESFEIYHSWNKPVYVFCGKGNNGGDGLAIARLLQKKNKRKVEVYVVEHSERGSDEFETNLKRLNKIQKVHHIRQDKDIPDLRAKDGLVVDAIFGVGLSRPAEGIAAKVIAAINQSTGAVWSVDIPSGLFADRLNGKKDAVVKSSRVVTFHAPKLSFFPDQNEDFIQEVEVVDIGLDKEYYSKIKSPYLFNERMKYAGMIPARPKFSHKGDYGHALLIGGSLGKMGAMILAARAAARSGAGLISAMVPGLGYEMMQTAVPEVMLAGAEVKKMKESILSGKLNVSLDKFTAIGIGPGMGTDKETMKFFESVLNGYKGLMVLDADALNLLAQKKSLIKKVPKGSILTPHPGEFRRLAGEWKDDLDKLKLQMKFAESHGVYVVLKGANTSIASPDGTLTFNSTGNPGMAKGGSGDVLTGIITALLATGLKPELTAGMGVFFHGRAGDIARTNLGETAMNAGDIINCLPDVYRTGEKNPNVFKVYL